MSQSGCFLKVTQQIEKLVKKIQHLFIQPQ